MKLSSTAQYAANRINSQKSTGPKSAEGKAASSQNNLRHGFRGKFKLFESEDRAAYDELLESLREEHQPAGITEDLIVQRMSEHFWLARRAEAFQFQAAEMTGEGEVGTKEFAEAMVLWTRYETTHERAFFKCLNELNKLKAERRKQERQDQIGFERQKQAEANEKRKQELHEARLRTAKRTKTPATHSIEGMSEAIGYRSGNPPSALTNPATHTIRAMSEAIGYAAETEAN